MKTKNERLEFKKKLLNSLKKLEINKEIHSLHLIGSHTDENKDLNRINDFDILVLLKDKLNPKNYSNVRNNLNSICEKFETNKVHLDVEIIHGNVKLKPKKQINIQLHQLTFYYKDFIIGFNDGNLALHNWVLTGKTIFGTDLKKLVEIKPILREQLIHKRDSINFFLQIINKKKNIGVKHIVQGEELVKESVEIPVTELDELELFYVAINETLATLMKYQNQENKLYSIKEREQFLMKVLENKEYLKVYQSLGKIKANLRNCKEVKFDLNYFKKVTLDILNQLKKKFNL